MAPIFDSKEFKGFVDRHPKVLYATHAWPSHQPEMRNFIETNFDLLKRCRGESDYFDVFIYSRKADKPVITNPMVKASDDPQWSLQLSSVPLKEPLGIAVGPRNEVYVCDSANNRIVVLSETGQELRAWGREGSGAGEFKTPADIAVAKDETVYVVDMWNGRVQAFDREGHFLRSIGKRGGSLADAEKGELYGPRGIDISEDGSLFVTDTGNCFIYQFAASGGFINRWGGKGKNTGQFDEPVGLWCQVDSITVADTRNRRVQTFGSSGNYLSEKTVGGWTDSWTSPHLCRLTDGAFFLSDSRANKILVLEAGSGETSSLELPSDQPLVSPMGLSSDSSDRLYVSEKTTGRIRRLLVK